jgi:hypothetical protein
VSGVRGETAFAELASLQFIDVDEVPQPIASGAVRTATGLKSFFASMTAAAAPTSHTGFGNSSSPVDISTAAASVTITGGVAPFEYLWERSDANPGDWAIVNDEAAATAFTAEAVDPGTTAEAEFKCTVTDATGATAETNVIARSARNLAIAP